MLIAKRKTSGKQRTAKEAELPEIHPNLNEQL